MSAAEITRVGTELLFRPKPYEVDFTGFLSNTIATKWMEDLRISLMDRHFPDFDNERPEHLSVIVETHIKYRKPVRYSDVIQGYAWIESHSLSRWVIAFRFQCVTGGHSVFEGRQVGAFVNPENLMPVRIPHTIRQLLTMKRNMK